MNNKEIVAGSLMGLLATFMWSLNGVWVNLADGFTAAGFIGSRFCISFILFLSLALSLDIRGLTQSFRHPIYFTGLALLLATNTCLATLSFYYTTVASAVILQSCIPLIIPILQRIRFGQHHSLKTWLGIVIGFSGVVVVFADKGISFSSQHLIGNTIALSSATCFSVYSLIVKNRHFSAYTNFTWVCFVGMLLAPLVSFGFNQPWIEAKPSMLATMCIVGFAVCNTISHPAYHKALKLIGAVRASTVILAQPVLAVILAWLVLGQTPGTLVILGMPLVLAGISVVLRSK